MTRVVWGKRGAKKSSGILSYLISISLLASSTSGALLVGGLQQEEVSNKIGEGSLPGRHTTHLSFLPLVPNYK